MRRPRDDRHGDALLRRRRARARRRHHRHRLAQPEGVHGDEDRAPRRACPSAATRGFSTCATGPWPAARPGPVPKERCRPVDIWPGYVDRVMSFIDVSAVRPLQRRDRRGERDGGGDAPTGARPPSGGGGSLLLRAGRLLPEPRAEPAPAGEPRVHRREDARGGRRPRRRLRRGRATGASSSTTPASSCRATSSPRSSPSSCSRRSRARRSSTTCARAGPCPRRSSALGGVALVNRVGHAFIKQRMRKEDAAFAGEVSGHYYFRDFSQADTGVVPFLLMLELISKRGRKLSEILAPLREQYFITGELNTPVDGRRAQAAGAEGALRGPTGRRSRTSTASRSSSTTGTSTCARRTPSRCCASTSKRSRKR